jgi:hypothetical protein
MLNSTCLQKEKVWAFAKFCLIGNKKCVTEQFACGSHMYTNLTFIFKTFNYLFATLYAVNVRWMFTEKSMQFDHILVYQHGKMSLCSY